MIRDIPLEIAFIKTADGVDISARAIVLGKVASQGLPDLQTFRRMRYQRLGPRLTYISRSEDQERTASRPSSSRSEHLRELQAVSTVQNI